MSRASDPPQPPAWSLLDKTARRLSFSSAMVFFHVNVSTIEARSFLEGLDQNHVSDKASCKAKIKAQDLQRKASRGNESLVTSICR